MITIRSSTVSSEPTLIGLEVILTTARGTYIISSNGSVADFSSPFGGGLFGAISWPRSRFQLVPGVVLEQQMFLPHDGSAAAFSWQLHSELPLRARLTIKPFFSGCAPRSYRDVGFRVDSEQEGARLAWLPSVRGPRIIADTNGKYHDQPRQSFNVADEETASGLWKNLVAPGTFEFDLSNRPSVLILSAENQRDQHVGAFLAGLMRDSYTSKKDLAADDSPQAEADAHLIAA
jgi:hypothetical protein